MWPARARVKVQNTQDIDRLAAAVLDLHSLLNSPQRDTLLLDEAGVQIDRALFALLVLLEVWPSACVGEVAERVGRDHTTVSRQLAKLASLGLIEREGAPTDRRRRPARLTSEGRRMVAAITAARRRLLSRALAGWAENDIALLADLNRRFADSLIAFAGRSVSPGR